MKNTVFITGTGRCGTNVLKNILTRHSEIASLPFEQRFTVDPDGLFDFYRSSISWSPFISNKKLTRLANFLRLLASKEKNQENRIGPNTAKFPYQDWELDKWIPGYSDFVEQLLEEITQFSYDAKYPGKPQNDKMSYSFSNREMIGKGIMNFLKNCNSSILRGKQQNVLVEDNTWTFLFAEEALELTPNSLLIHMVRDPRDVISSMKNQRWTPNNLEDLVQYYQDLISAWKVQKNKISADRFVEIKFEEFIQSPKKLLTEICSLIGIPFESEMLDLDLSKSNIGRYDSSFNKEEVDYLNSTLSHILSEYKYN